LWKPPGQLFTSSFARLISLSFGEVWVDIYSHDIAITGPTKYSSRSQQVVHDLFLSVDGNTQARGNEKQVRVANQQAPRSRRRSKASSGEGYSPPLRLRGLESVVSSPSGVRGGGPA